MLIVEICHNPHRKLNVYYLYNFSGEKRFTRTCDVTGMTDDLTIGVIIGIPVNLFCYSVLMCVLQIWYWDIN